MKNENSRITVNRIVSFLFGGLLVFAVMSFTVVNSAKKQNVELTKTLDTSRYEAGRLLADAKAQFSVKDYAKAAASLENLFEKQPGSAESVEGGKLMLTIKDAEKAANVKWEAAMPEEREKFVKTMTAELRAKSDEARAQMEKEMTETINQEWEKAKSQIRENWEKQS